MDAGESVRQSLLKEFEDSIKDIWAPPAGQKLGGSEEPFFQRQQRGRHCGMHALNNILGGNFVTPTDMMEAAKAYLSEQGHGTGDELEDLVEKDGNYSIEALASVLRDKGYSLDLSEPAATSLERAKGFLQHRPESTTGSHHWIAYRYCAGAIWRLDSLMERPEQITPEELAKELSENRTFAIQRPAHG
ncbi:JOSD1 [Symbiodinium sp. CCMP2592]|nr:JOSD1 [Symbiodinium sp. CCMP2592]